MRVARVCLQKKRASLAYEIGFVRSVPKAYLEMSPRHIRCKLVCVAYACILFIFRAKIKCLMCHQKYEITEEKLNVSRFHLLCVSIASISTLDKNIVAKSQNRVQLKHKILDQQASQVFLGKKMNATVQSIKR